MALNRTELELTVKTVGQQAISELNQKLGLTRAEAKKVIAEFYGFEKAKDVVEDFGETVLSTEKGIERYVRFLQKQRSEVQFAGDQYKQLTAEILQYQSALKKAQAAAVIEPMSANDLNTERGLRQQIQTLREQRAELQLSSTEYQQLSATIRQYEAALRSAQGVEEKTGQDPMQGPRQLNYRTQAGLQEYLTLLREQRSQLEYNTQAFAEYGQKISQVESLLKRVSEIPVAQPSEDQLRTVRGLQQEISRLQQRRDQIDYTSDAYKQLSARITEYEAVLKRVQGREKQTTQGPAAAEYIYPTTTLKGLQQAIAQARGALETTDIRDPNFKAFKADLEDLNQLYAERSRIMLQPVSDAEQKTERGLQRQIAYLREQRAELDIVSAEYRKITGQIETLENRLKAAAGKAKELAPERTYALNTERGVQQQIAALREQRAELSLTSAEYARLTKQINQYQAELDRAQQGEAAIGGRFGGRLLGAAGAVGATSLFGGGIISGLGAGAGYLAGGQAGAFAAAGIAQSIQMTVMPATELAAQVSRLNKVLSEESGVQYARNLEFIRTISISTGQTLPEATQSFLKLNASVKAAGGDAETARGVYEAIAGAIVKFGGSAQDVNGALTATTQIFSKGKVQAEELQGQIGERLVGAYVKFAQANGWTTKQLSKFLEEGEVTLEQFLKFADFIQKDGVKALDDYGKSAEGAGNRFNAAFSQFQVKIGQALLPAGAALQDFGVKLLEVSGDAIVGLVNGIKQLTAAFQAIPKPVVDATVAFVAFLGAWRLLTAAVAAVQGLKAAVWFGELATAIATTGGILPAASAAFQAFWVAVTGPVGATAAVVAGLAAIGVALYQNNEDFRNWVDAVGQIISEDWKRGMDSMQRFAKGAFDWIGNGLSNLGKTIGDAFGGIGKTISDGLSGVTNRLIGWYNSLPSWAKIAFGRTVGGDGGAQLATGIEIFGGLNQRVQQRVQANRRAAINQTIGSFYGQDNGFINPFASSVLERGGPGNDIQKSLPGQSGGDDDKKEKEKKAARDKALQDYFNKMLRLQKEAFDNQMAYDRQLFENRLRRQKEEFDRRTELARLSEEASISDLGEGGKRVAGLFQELRDRRRSDEAELFQLRQSYDQKLFQIEQKNLQDLFDKRQELIREQAKDVVTPGNNAAAGFSTFTSIAQSMGLLVTSGYRPGDPGYHGKDQAKDYGGSPQNMLRFARYMAEEFGSQLKELIYTPLGFGIKDGKRVPLSFWGDAVNRNHYDHVHAAFTGAPGARAATPARPTNAPRVNLQPNVGDSAALRAAAASDLEEISKTKAFQIEVRSRVIDKTLAGFRDAVKETVKPLDDAKKSADEQLASAQNYFNLLAEGITPELKKQFDQIDEIAKKEREMLSGMADRLQLEMVSNDLTEDQRKRFQEQLDLIRAYLKSQGGVVGEVKKTVVAATAAEERLQRIKDLAGGIANSVGNTIGKAFDLVIDGTEDWGRSLQEIASGVLREIANQILQIMVIRPITQVLSNVLPGFLGGLFANGGIMTADGPVPLRTYARGGIANDPQLALFGEGSMPEAYVPLPDGRRIPVVMQGGGGGGTSVVVNVDARGTQVQGNDANGQQLGRVISQAVQAELIRQKRPGGLLVGA
ncbi:MAG: tape measure protein [Limnohabitans sp.]